MKEEVRRNRQQATGNRQQGIRKKSEGIGNRQQATGNRQQGRRKKSEGRITNDRLSTVN
jgi:hypothetical protein